MIIEICVDSVESLEAALAGGADRIELCSALALGGLTPSVGFMRMAAGCGIAVVAMIRPRAGDFVYSAHDLGVMEADIAAARDAGLQGVVFGANLADGRLDTSALASLLRAAAGLDVTLHRAFDLVPEMDLALDQAIGLGFRRVLTSGGAATAVAGIAALTRLQARSAGRIVVMPGAGVRADTVALLTPMRPVEIHGSCAGGPRSAGFGFGGQRVTEADEVRALRKACDRLFPAVARH